MRCGTGWVVFGFDNLRLQETHTVRIGIAFPRSVMDQAPKVQGTSNLLLDSEAHTTIGPATDH